MCKCEESHTAIRFCSDGGIMHCVIFPQTSTVAELHYTSLNSSSTSLCISVNVCLSTMAENMDR